MRSHLPLIPFLLAALLGPTAALGQTPELVGVEIAVPERLQNGEEFDLPFEELIEHGRRLFVAQWTPQEGGGRPLSKGVGTPLSDPARPLRFPFNFNRVSAMDSNGCAGCHNAPFGVPGGGGDFVTGVFVAAQRFDSATFDATDPTPLRGSRDEVGNPVLLGTIGNYRATLGMFGSGYIEMLARQMTEELQAIRDSIAPGAAAALATKGVGFGVLRRALDGSWDVSDVEGLPAQALAGDPPSLVLQPFHQSGSVVSIRQFTNNAFNHHHGIQSQERFGIGADPDGDGFADELTVAEVTAATLYQATLGVPGQVVPNHIEVEEAIYFGERIFEEIGCASCHVSALPLTDEGRFYVEPNPFNPPGNLRPGEAEALTIDLSDEKLPGLRLKPDKDGVVWVPAYTDLKLHDITAGDPNDPNREAIDINAADPLVGNSRFITKKLWGAANEPPYFHHGKYTTLREATLAHWGEAAWTRANFVALSAADQDRVIEFLKSLQVLPPGTKFPVVDENMRRKPNWPPKSFFSWRFTAAGR